MANTWYAAIIKVAGNYQQTGVFIARLLPNGTAVLANSQVGKKPDSCKAYPNPFKDAITLAYNLEQPENVTINLYDMQDRMVENISTDALQSGTINKIIHPNSTLSAGTYSENRK